MVDSEPAKLFVGGIGWSTTDGTLQQHFSQYGEVLSSVIARDRCKGTPRGFGFVVFVNPSSADKALEDTQHVIQGRKVDVKRAIPRSERVESSHKHLDHNQITEVNGTSFSKDKNGTSSGGRLGENQIWTRKVFVGGLKADLTVDEFRGYFERFGRIEDIVVMRDNKTNRSRGFGFITFESEEVVENVVRNRFHEVEGKVAEVKRAIPKKSSSVSCNERGCSGGVPSRGGYMKDNYVPRDCMRGGVAGCYYGANSGGYVYQMGVDSCMAYAVPLAVPMNPWWYLPMHGTGLLGCHSPYYPANMDSRFDKHHAMTSSGSADSDCHGSYYPTSMDSGLDMHHATRSSGCVDSVCRRCDWDAGSNVGLPDNTALDARCNISGDLCSIEKPGPEICIADGPLHNSIYQVNLEQAEDDGDDDDDSSAGDTGQDLNDDDSLGT